MRKPAQGLQPARGEILTADGQIVAQSVPTDRRLQVPARLPAGRPVRAHRGLPVVRQPRGHVGRRGVVQRGAHRAGHQPAARRPRRVAHGQAGDEQRGALAHPDARSGPREQSLAGQRGSVVALDVHDGAVLAMYSNPTFNPNGLSVHDTQVVQTTFNQINSGDQAALPRAYRDRYSPGSTFKVVTSKSAIEAGHRHPRRPGVPRRRTASRSRTPTRNLRQLRRCGNPCGGTLTESLVNSCNATFARLGYELGERVPAGHAAVRHRQRAADRPGAQRGRRASGPPAGADQARFALAGIGQGDVFTTPLQMALIAAGIGNSGVIMEPHVVKEIQNSDGKTVRTIEPEAVDDVHVAGDRAGAHQHDGRRRRTRAPATGVADRPRHPGGRQDGHRADRRRRRGPARVVHRVRARRTRRSTRSR